MIAIIGCKRQKQDYECSADEMYSIAPTYAAQQKWISQAYDDYYIFSSKYGIIHHTQVIKPYDVTLEDTVMKYQIARTSTEANISDIEQKIKDFMSTHVDKTLHFHVTLGYWKYIKQYKSQRVIHIKQQRNTGMVYKRYMEAVGHNVEEGIPIVTKPSPPNPESKHTWYHPDYEDFYGIGFELWKEHKDKINKFDQAVLRKVGFGIYSHHKQWRIRH